MREELDFPQVVLLTVDELITLLLKLPDSVLIHLAMPFTLLMKNGMLNY